MEQKTVSATSSTVTVPKLGPEPTLLSRKEFDALYEILEAVKNALEDLKVDAIVTGGSLLGAIRQHSILFCDDDIDLTVIDYDGTIYESVVKPKLQDALGEKYIYQIAPWEGGDRIRPKRMSNIFLDLFVLRKYESMQELKQVIGVKKNGQPQSEEYVGAIIQKIARCAGDLQLLCPFWHFSTRKAVEMWSKEVYWSNELFPLRRDLKMGPVIRICGPRMPVKLLKRAFGDDCFDVYFQSISHHSDAKHQTDYNKCHHAIDNAGLPPLVAPGGTWESGIKQSLKDEHYIPIQPIAKAKRRPTLHNREQLEKYLALQSQLEESLVDELAVTPTLALSDMQPQRPRRTIYMDGVFDLFHIGHLEAIQNCAKLGDRVIIGVTGDDDATEYKRRPIVPEEERCAIVKSLKQVDDIVCPCPLIVTEDFMETHAIDLVVHGFANDADAERQREFFEIPIRTGRFKKIPYFHGVSTTDRLALIQDIATSEVYPKNTEKEKLSWFGSTLTAATSPSFIIPYDPFPITLRQSIEPHIVKARQRRHEALAAFRTSVGEKEYTNMMDEYTQSLSCEAHFHFESSKYQLREALLTDVGLSRDYDLSQLHNYPGKKFDLLEKLTRDHSLFQNVFDVFVRTICAPQVAEIFPCEEIYYQAFPCLRMVQPGEFSIGPHCDAAYGHHPCSTNFYVPFTQIDGAASLFLESKKGSEDWHPIKGSYGTFNVINSLPFPSLPKAFSISYLQLTFIRVGHQVCWRNLFALDHRKQAEIHSCIP